MSLDTLNQETQLKSTRYPLFLLTSLLLSLIIRYYCPVQTACFDLFSKDLNVRYGATD